MASEKKPSPPRLESDGEDIPDGFVVEKLDLSSFTAGDGCDKAGSNIKSKQSSFDQIDGVVPLPSENGVEPTHKKGHRRSPSGGSLIRQTEFEQDDVLIHGNSELGSSVNSNMSYNTAGSDLENSLSSSTASVLTNGPVVQRPAYSGVVVTQGSRDMVAIRISESSNPDDPLLDDLLPDPASTYPPAKVKKRLRGNIYK